MTLLPAMSVSVADVKLIKVLLEFVAIDRSDFKMLRSITESVIVMTVLLEPSMIPPVSCTPFEAFSLL